jgi:serine/threonine protein kinase
MIIERGCFSEDEARGIFKQMLIALNYCHSQKVAHRDLKP